MLKIKIITSLQFLLSLISKKIIKEFEEKTFTIKINSVSEPIETDVGFHILEVFERKGDKAPVRHIRISPQIEKSE